MSEKVKIEGQEITVENGQREATLPDGRKFRLFWGETFPETFLKAEAVNEVRSGATLYATAERFNGQALSLGRVILVDNAHDLSRSPVIPAMITDIEPENHDHPAQIVTTEGTFFWKDFVSQPNTATTSDGRVLITLPGDGWCWPPRV